MNIRYFVLPLIMVAGSTSFATGWYPSQTITQSSKIDMEPLRCPTIGKDHSQMVTQLQALQDKIKKDANCDQLSKQLQEIGTLSGDRRTTFLEAIAKINSGATLSDREMSTQVIKYAEDVTVAAGSLATLLSQSGQCFGEQDMATNLQTLSSFVNEASTLLSTVAGPWGPALSIGGKVVSGFITGVNKFINSLPGYDFKDKKDWQGYVETLCAFHEQQDEIYAMIHPDTAIQDLSQLEGRLQTQLQRLMAITPMSSELFSSFNAEDNDALASTAKKIDSTTPGQLALKTVRLMTAQRWITQRIEAIEVEAKDPLAPGQYLIQKQRDEIEQFLIAEQGPKFIRFQVNEANNAVGELSSFISRQGLNLYQQLLMMDRSFLPKDAPDFAWVNAETALKTLMSIDERRFAAGKGNAEKQFASQVVFFKRELQKKWDAVNVSYGVKQSFCEFFSLAGYYNDDFRSNCTSSRAKNVETAMTNFAAFGLAKQTPPYLKKSAMYQGMNWTESLDIWIDQLD